MPLRRGVGGGVCLVGIPVRTWSWHWKLEALLFYTHMGVPALLSMSGGGFRKAHASCRRRHRHPSVAVSSCVAFRGEE